jgi:hypothetical protein
MVMAPTEYEALKKVFLDKLCTVFHHPIRLLLGGRYKTQVSRKSRLFEFERLSFDI